MIASGSDYEGEKKGKGDGEFLLHPFSAGEKNSFLLSLLPDENGKRGGTKV